MNDIPIINHLPEKWRGWAVIAALAFPYLTRAWHALLGGGGLRGILRSIFYGTNTAPEVKADIKSIGAAVDRVNQQGPSPFAPPAVENKTPEVPAQPKTP